MSGRIAQEIENSKPIPLPVELVLNVYRTAAALNEWTAQLLEPFDLRPEEYNILRILRGAGPEGHPRAEVERRMLQSTDRLSSALHRLKTRGAVDGVFTVRITEAGMELLAGTDGVIDRAMQERMGSMPEAQLRAAIEVLESVRSATGS